MSWYNLDFGSMDSQAPQISAEPSYDSLAEYMAKNYPQQTSGLMPTDTSKGYRVADVYGGGPDTMVKGNGDDTLKYLTQAFSGNSQLPPLDWYNQGINAHKQGSGLGSILAMFL